VQAVHQVGLAHGDIRPEKILLPPGGGAKLFGFADACPAEPAETSADLRALGALARDCLCGAAEPGSSAPGAGQLRKAAADLAALCASPAADQPDGAAAVADRVAALRAQLGQPAGTGPRPVGSPAPTPLPPPTPSPLAGPPTVTWPGRPSPSGTPAAEARQPAAQVGPLPAPPDRHKPAHRGTAAVVRAAAAIAIALAAVALFAAVRPNGGAPAANGADTASVRVAAARLIGEPVRVVRHRLQRAGLVVRTRWQHSYTTSAGDVMTIRPAGLVPAHSTVLIIGSSGPPATSPAPGQARTRHRHLSRAPHKTVSESPTPPPSPSPSSSPTQSPSPTSSPSPSSSPSAPPTSPTIQQAAG
jgi:hypothetical protein